MLKATSRAVAVRAAAYALMAVAVVLSPAVRAYDGPVEKKTFTLPSYTTVGGKDAQGCPRRLRDLRNAQRRRRQRDLRPAFLHGDVARGGQIRSDRRGPGLLGPDHRRRQADRHRQVLRRQRGRARESQYQGSEGRDDRPVDDQSCDRQAVGARVSRRLLPRHGARAQGAPRPPRRDPAPRGHRRVRRLDPGHGMGGRIS